MTDFRALYESRCTEFD